ncbi:MULTISPECIES: pseudouridine synthase [Candidatus Ichthyocystis]|uniref:Pseudouridine synthase n=1 Tax=Candidatus Ichthyocystis hellenicum TaxID=1561003 RepID=A0A0S4LZ68_9BURK|nr:MULTISPECIES: pseudouridine synthase [Ichthyocystis]CUT16869.1 putative pseudouridine synthase B [Candidatus Ichthyocystis hellenicum]
MIYRQKRKFSHSSRTQRANNVDRVPGPQDSGNYHDNYRPDVMTLHTLGVSANSTSNSGRGGYDPRFRSDVAARSGRLQNQNFRDGNFRAGNFRDGNVRDGNFRDGNVRDSNFRDGNVRDGNFRDGNVRDSNFRDGNVRDGNFRGGSSSRDGNFRGSGVRDGNFRGGSSRDGNFRPGNYGHSRRSSTTDNHHGGRDNYQGRNFQGRTPQTKDAFSDSQNVSHSRHDNRRNQSGNWYNSRPVDDNRRTNHGFHPSRVAAKESVLPRGGNSCDDFSGDRNSQNGNRGGEYRRHETGRAGHAFRRNYIRRDKKNFYQRTPDHSETDEFFDVGNVSEVEVGDQDRRNFSRARTAPRRYPRSGSGEFNKNRVSLLPSADTPQRLHKILANAGVGSRRDMEQLIIDGAVTVNGSLAEIGQKVFTTDVVSINGKVVKVDHAVAIPRILLYYKPEGQIVSRDDPDSRPSVFDNLPELEEGSWVPVGRLDFNTSGLLMFTTSGDLANHLMHPRYEIEREYAVRINCVLTEDQVQCLLKGVELGDGLARFRTVIDAHPQQEGTDSDDSDAHVSCNHWYRVILSEGRNREVRRIFESLNIVVTRLIRVRYGDLWLPTDLRRGQSLEMSRSDVCGFLTKLEKRLNYYFDRKKSGRSPVHCRRWLMRRRGSSAT